MELGEGGGHQRDARCDGDENEDRALNVEAEGSECELVEGGEQATPRRHLSRRQFYDDWHFSYNRIFIIYLLFFFVVCISK